MLLPTKFYNWIKQEKYRYYLIGTFFLFLQLLVFIENHHAQRFGHFFWFCNHTPLIFALAFFLRKKQLIKGIINIGFLIQFVWAIDFLSYGISGFTVLGVTQYVFNGGMGIYTLVPIIVHLFSTNIALISTYEVKPKKITLLYSAVYILLLFSLTLTYAPPEKNINCIYFICTLEKFSIPGYFYLWPILIFLILALPTQGIQYLIYKHSKRKTHNSLK
ncbi:MAG: hypothetical protein KKF56_01725 [Nanoarchaeota archaeon]|nr:hypothetical protein [Nanoarchaeota archaeon]